MKNRSMKAPKHHRLLRDGEAHRPTDIVLCFDPPEHAARWVRMDNPIVRTRLWIDRARRKKAKKP